MVEVLGILAAGLVVGGGVIVGFTAAFERLGWLT